MKPLQDSTLQPFKRSKTKRPTIPTVGGDEEQLLKLVQPPVTLSDSKAKGTPLTQDPTCRYVAKKNERPCPPTDMYNNVHRSLILI